MFARLLEDVLKTSWRRLQNVLKRLQNVLKTFLQAVLRTFWRRLQDVLKISWRRLQDVFKTSWRRLGKTSWGRLEDVRPRRMYWSWSRSFHVFWRRKGKTSSSRWMFAGNIGKYIIYKSTRTASLVDYEVKDINKSQERESKITLVWLCSL